jgi:hypothetical protein
MDISEVAQMMQKRFAGKTILKGYKLSGPTQMAPEMQADAAKYNELKHFQYWPPQFPATSIVGEEFVGTAYYYCLVISAKVY